MTSKPWNKESVEDSVTFPIDFQNWQMELNRIERKILKLLLDGYSAAKISAKLKLKYAAVRDYIKSMKAAFIRYFHINNKTLPQLG
jgi:DNA-binding CsgD family transcriptional regulator